MGITVGIIGCGSITKFRHAPEYKVNPHIDDIVFFDNNFERAHELAKTFGGRAVATVEELIAAFIRRKKGEMTDDISETDTDRIQ